VATGKRDLVRGGGKPLGRTEKRKAKGREKLSKFGGGSGRKAILLFREKATLTPEKKGGVREHRELS